VTTENGLAVHIEGSFPDHEGILAKDFSFILPPGAHQIHAQEDYQFTKAVTLRWLESGSDLTSPREGPATVSGRSETVALANGGGAPSHIATLAVAVQGSGSFSFDVTFG
jgi:hypothetical protein